MRCPLPAHSRGQADVVDPLLYPSTSSLIEFSQRTWVRKMQKFRWLSRLPVVWRSGGDGCGIQRRLSRPSTAAGAVGSSKPDIAMIQSATEANGVVREKGRRNGRLRVAIDIDEVLGRFLFALNHFCKERYAMEYDVPDYFVYEFAKIWGCSQDMSNHIVHEFFESPQFRGGIPVMPGSQETLHALSSWCDLVVVTSRQHVIREPTLEWLGEHFPDLFQSVHFGNHFAMNGESKKKSDICRDINVDVLVDDNPKYAIECASAGVHVVLYDWQCAYPWSKLPHGTDHPQIQVATDWLGVEEAVRTVKLTDRAAGPDQRFTQDECNNVTSIIR